MRKTLIAASTGLALSAAPALADDPNKPATCFDIWGDIGLPVSHKDPGAILLNVTNDIDPPSVIICHQRFVVQYNCYTKNPDWVIERLSVETTLGDNTRPKVKFQPEPNIPKPEPVAAPKPDPVPATTAGSASLVPTDDNGNSVILNGEMLTGATVHIDTSNGVNLTLTAPGSTTNIPATTLVSTPSDSVPAHSHATSFDPCVSAVDDEYKNSGFARGHNAASADFKKNADWMIDTFVLSNAIPQVQHGFNGGTWKELEEHVQDLAKSLPEEDSIFVITGPVDLPREGEPTIIPADQNACHKRIRLAGIQDLIEQKTAICDGNDKDPSFDCQNGVAVPAGMYKIIYEPQMDRAFGFMMTNEDHRKFKDKNISHTAYFEEWRASLDVIEETTNLNFFPDKSQRWRNIHETSCPATRWRR